MKIHRYELKALLKLLGAIPWRSRSAYRAKEKFLDFRQEGHGISAILYTYEGKTMLPP